MLSGARLHREIVRVRFETRLSGSYAIVQYLLNYPHQKLSARVLPVLGPCAERLGSARLAEVPQRIANRTTCSAVVTTAAEEVRRIRATAPESLAIVGADRVSDLDAHLFVSATSLRELVSIFWKSGEAKMMFLAAARRRSTASAGRANEVGN